MEMVGSVRARGHPEGVQAENPTTRSRQEASPQGLLRWALVSSS